MELNTHLIIVFCGVFFPLCLVPNGVWKAYQSHKMLWWQR
jgi:hypothetical protein